MPNTSIRIGYSLSLSGPLAANGQTARLAHQIWQKRTNEGGGLLGREVELVCVDDRSDASSVAAIYEALLAEEKVDLLLGGYGNNSITPAMPIAIDHGKYFVGLMGLGVNISSSYDRYFAMIPTGTDPNAALTAGFFETAACQTPALKKIAIVAADAAFTKNPIEGARANAVKNELEVVSETKYDLATTDFTEVLRQSEKSGPDILFLCSYLNDSVGLIRAIAESDLDPMLVGGAMIGPQSSAVQTQLGSLINGIVNYEYWLPTDAMNFPGVRDLISTYQEQARDTSADALGYYVAPFAYAQLQVVEQAIRESGRDRRLRAGGIHPLGDVFDRRRRRNVRTTRRVGRAPGAHDPVSRHRVDGHLGVRESRRQSRSGAGRLRERRTGRPVPRLRQATMNVLGSAGHRPEHESRRWGQAVRGSLRWTTAPRIPYRRPGAGRGRIPRTLRSKWRAVCSRPSRRPAGDALRRFFARHGGGTTTGRLGDGGPSRRRGESASSGPGRESDRVRRKLRGRAVSIAFINQRHDQAKEDLPMTDSTAVQIPGLVAGTWESTRPTPRSRS